MWGGKNIFFTKTRTKYRARAVVNAHYRQRKRDAEPNGGSGEAISTDLTDRITDAFGYTSARVSDDSHNVAKEPLCRHPTRTPNEEPRLHEPNPKSEIASNVDANRLAAALGCSARAEKPPAQRISYTDAPPIFCTPLLRLEPRMVPRNCGLSASSTSSTSAGPSPRTRHIKHVVVYPYCASWRPSCPAQLSRCCGPGTCRCRCPRGPARPPR